MRFNEIFEKTLIGNTKVEAYAFVSSDEDGYTMHYTGVYTAGDRVPGNIRRAKVLHVWPTEKKTLAVSIMQTGEAKHDKN